MTRPSTRSFLFVAVLAALGGCAADAADTAETPAPLAAAALPELDLDEVIPMPEDAITEAWRARALAEPDSALVAEEYEARGCIPRELLQTGYAQAFHANDLGAQTLAEIRARSFTVGSIETEEGPFVVVEQEYDCRASARPRVITVFAAPDLEDPPSGGWRESYGMTEDATVGRFEFVDVEGGEIVVSETSVGAPLMGDGGA